jgi:hypothetical protein
VLQRAAMIGAAIGAVSSLALMFRAGRHQKSLILFLLFAIWVVSPFVGLVWANLISKRWLPLARVMLYGVTVALALACPAIYADVALERTTLKVGFVFLVVPFVSWLLIGVLVSIAFLSSRKASRQHD